MLSDWELWACANQFIERHGADAPIHAAMRADALHEDGDEAGAAAFRQIVHRINRLQSSPSGALN
jgi:hypothetical protein